MAFPLLAAAAAAASSSGGSGGGGGIPFPKFELSASGKKGKKRTAAIAKGLSAIAAAQPEEIRTRRTAAEQTYSNVLARLGAEGTYGDSAGTTGGGSILGDQGDVFKTEKAKSGFARDIDRRFHDDSVIQDITSLDPEKATKAIEKSKQFQIMSRLTGEAEDILERKGELWEGMYEEMLETRQLPILEGSAAIARENAETLKRAFAKGGAARRSAFETVQRIRGQERINSMKVQALSQVRTQIDNLKIESNRWARGHAMDVLNQGQAWAQNLGGIRESYNNAMDMASQLMLESALPIMAEYQSSAMAARAAASQAQRNKLGRWISGAAGIFLIGASMSKTIPTDITGGSGGSTTNIIRGGSTAATSAAAPSGGGSLFQKTGPTGLSKLK